MSGDRRHRRRPGAAGARLGRETGLWDTVIRTDTEALTKKKLYQVKDFSRTTTRVLMRLDPSKLDLKNPRVHRTDGDLAVTWARTYGQGRVFYSTLATSRPTGTGPKSRP